jgi:ABC-type lipoprotein export system ATPase subunit
LLDEPTGDLDTFNTLNAVQLFHHLNQNLKMTLIMVTHDVHLKNVATRVIYLRDGKLSKEEIVPPSKRTAVLNDIKRKLDTMKKDKKDESESGHSSKLVETEFRQPSDYPTFQVRRMASIGSTK